MEPLAAGYQMIVVKGLGPVPDQLLLPASTKALTATPTVKELCLSCRSWACASVVTLNPGQKNNIGAAHKMTSARRRELASKSMRQSPEETIKSLSSSSADRWKRLPHLFGRSDRTAFPRSRGRLAATCVNYAAGCSTPWTGWAQLPWMSRFQQALPRPPTLALPAETVMAPAPAFSSTRARAFWAVGQT